MKNYLVIFCMLFFTIAFQSINAQISAEDSLWLIVRDPVSTPEQRKTAMQEIFKFSKDTRREEKKEFDELSSWFKQTQMAEDSIVERLVLIVIEPDSLHTKLDRKGMAIKLLAESGNPKAYSFLIKNFDLYVPAIDISDDAYLRKATFNYLFENSKKNWVLFPEIIDLMSSKELEIEDAIGVALILDNIVQDPFLVIALLNLYEQKENNPTFNKNKKDVVHYFQERN